MIHGNASGGFGMPKIIELVDSNGDTVIGTVVDSKIDLTATRDDVKVGKIFASDDGVQEGEDTKTYRTTQGSRIIKAGKEYSVPLPEYDQYNYTKFQAVIAKFNTTIQKSVEVNQIVLNDSVYEVNSTNKVSDVIKDETNKSIDFKIINNTENLYVIHYSTYKEE